MPSMRGMRMSVSRTSTYSRPMISRAATPSSATMHVEAVALEQDAHPLAHRLFVVDDEDAQRLAIAADAGRLGLRGRVCAHDATLPVAVSRARPPESGDRLAAGTRRTDESDGRAAADRDVACAVWRPRGLHHQPRPRPSMIGRKLTRNVVPRPRLRLDVDRGVVVGHDAVDDRQTRARCPCRTSRGTAGRCRRSRRAGCRRLRR